MRFSYTFTINITEKHYSWVASGVFHLLFVLLVGVFTFQVEYNLPPLETAKTELKDEERKVPININFGSVKQSKASKTRSISDMLKELKTGKKGKTSFSKSSHSKTDFNKFNKISSRELQKKTGQYGLDKISSSLSEIDSGSVAFDLNQLRRNLSSHDVYFQKCYESALLKDEFLSGKVQVLLDVKTKGSLKNVKVSFNGRGHGKAISRLEGCVAKRAGRIKLDRKIQNTKIKFGLLFKS